MEVMHTPAPSTLPDPDSWSRSYCAADQSLPLAPAPTPSPAPAKHLLSSQCRFGGSVLTSGLSSVRGIGTSDANEVATGKRPFAFPSRVTPMPSPPPRSQDETPALTGAVSNSLTCGVDVARYSGTSQCASRRLNERRGGIGWQERWLSIDTTSQRPINANAAVPHQHGADALSRSSDIAAARGMPDRAAPQGMDWQTLHRHACALPGSGGNDVSARWPMPAQRPTWSPMTTASKQADAASLWQAASESGICRGPQSVATHLHQKQQCGIQPPAPIYDRLRV